MTKLKRMHIVKRCISFMLAFILASEAFFCEQNIVLAANKEAAGIIQGTDQNNLEGVVEENSSENNSSDSEAYDTEGLDILFEVEDNRDRTSKHFRLSDGTIMAADYGMDVHYEKDGAWKDIDNRFIYEAPTSADAMEGFSTAEGNVQFKFAPDTGDGEVVRAAAGGYSVGFEFLADADAGMMQEDGTVSMEDAELSVADASPVSEEALENDPNNAGYGILAEDISKTADAGMTEDNGSSMETDPVPITFIKGEVLNASEADVDFGNTIYDDSHGGASVLMRGLYEFLYGPISIYDKYIELFD